MAIFSRRLIQLLIIDNSTFLLPDQSEAIVSALNNNVEGRLPHAEGRAGLLDDLA